MSHDEIEEDRFMATHQPPKGMSYTEYIVWLRSHLLQLADEIEKLQVALDNVTKH